MIETKLVLLEGPPGSGKTTTAQKLANEILKIGEECQCFLEWSEDNPIAIGDDFNLGQVITTSITREEDVLRQWQQFVRANLPGKRITVMESRFWQTSMMLMYAAGHSMDRVIASNQRIIDTIQELKPVLIYFTVDDLRSFTEQVIRLKENEWRKAGFEGSWADHILVAFESQPWFKEHGLTGLEGMVSFLEEWASITELLYNRLAFPKIRIRNPHKDWVLTMQQIRNFLGLGGLDKM